MRPRRLALADQVRGAPAAARVRATVAYHRAAFAQTARTWETARRAQFIAGRRALLTPGAVTGAIARAQRATVSKAMIEVPDLRAMGFLTPADVPDDAAAWSAIGQATWGIGGMGPGHPAAHAAAAPTDDDEAPPQAARALPPPMVLDAASRALVAQLHNAGPDAQRATPAQLAALIARLEQRIVADSALNQFTLRQAIHSQIASAATTDFATLNAWIYDQVFATPKSDPWLGLLARTEFSGLPGDGVVAR